MGRDALDRIKETAPLSHSTSVLQIHGHRLTNAREKVAAVLEDESRAFTLAELSQKTGLSRVSVYRNTKLLLAIV